MSLIFLQLVGWLRRIIVKIGGILSLEVSISFQISALQVEPILTVMKMNYLLACLLGYLAGHWNCLLTTYYWLTMKILRRNAEVFRPNQFRPGHVLKIFCGQTYLPMSCWLAVIVGQPRATGGTNKRVNVSAWLGINVCCYHCWKQVVLTICIYTHTPT